MPKFVVMLAACKIGGSAEVGGFTVEAPSRSEAEKCALVAAWIAKYPAEHGWTHTVRAAKITQDDVDRIAVLVHSNGALDERR